MGSTAHYIDKDWKLQKHLAAFDFFGPPHGGEQIGEKILDIAEKTHITDKLQCLVGDSASSNVSGKRHFATVLEEKTGSKWSYMEDFIHCSAHSLNLVAKDLCELFVVKEKRHGKDIEVTYGDKDLESASRKGRMVGAIAKLSRMAALQNKGVHFLAAWKNCAAQVNATKRESKLKLITAVETRWSSRYFQIRRAIKLRHIYNRMTLDPAYVSYSLSENEWRLLIWLRDILAVIDKALQTLAATETVTISHMVPTFSMLFDALENYEAVDNETDQERQLREDAVKKAKDKLEKYYAHTSINPNYVFGMREFYYLLQRQLADNHLLSSRPSLWFPIH